MKQMEYLKNVVTLALATDKCIACGTCLTVCPREVFSLPEQGPVVIFHRDACMECGACARNCPTGALSVEAGVGCAAAVINSMLGRKGGSCCCIVEEQGVKTCGGGMSSGCC